MFLPLWGVLEMYLAFIRTNSDISVICIHENRFENILYKVVTFLV